MDRSPDEPRVPRRRLHLTLLFSLVLCAFSSAPAQQYRFRNYTVDDGLSQLVVQVVFQDRDGFIWIGTQAGLNRYDGHQFDVCSIRDGPASDRISAITQDPAGRIWIGTNGGLSVREGSAFKSYTREDGLLDPQVLSLAADDRGRIWIGTQSGLWRRDDTGFREIGDSAVHALLNDGAGRLWVGTGQGLLRQQGDGPLVPFTAGGLHRKRAIRIARDTRQHVWVLPEDGVRAHKDSQLVSAQTLSDVLEGMPRPIQMPSSATASAPSVSTSTTPNDGGQSQ